MNKVADHHANIADLYEALADDARRFAIALREGDADNMLIDTKDIIGPLEKAKRSALEQLNMLRTADPEWWQEFHFEHSRRRIAKMSPGDLVIELLTHAAECKKPNNCAYHQLLEDRAKSFSK